MHAVLLELLKMVADEDDAKDQKMLKGIGNSGKRLTLSH